MNFIETLVDSIANDLKEFIDNGFRDLKKRNWCIGSGSSFNIYKDLTEEEAHKIFKNLDVRCNFGKRIYKKEYGYTELESYYTMESNSGHTEIFKFEIDEIIEKENKNG